MCNDCEVDYEHVDIAREDFEQAQYFKSSSRIIPLTIDSKAELLQEGIFFPHSFICQKGFSNEKSWKSKKLSPLLLYQFQTLHSV